MHFGKKLASADKCTFKGMFFDLGQNNINNLRAHHWYNVILKYRILYL